MRKGNLCLFTNHDLILYHFPLVFGKSIGVGLRVDQLEIGSVSRSAGSAKKVELSLWGV